MAISSKLFKNNYKDLSVEKLEEKYEELKGHYYFNSKRDQIDYLLKNYLNASFWTNIDSERSALEELLKEKTGKDYYLKQKIFDIDLSDMINYVTQPTPDPFWKIAFTNFFKKLSDVEEEDKVTFLIELKLNNVLFNDFSKEIIKCKDINNTYNKYYELISDYIHKNKIIC